MRNIIDDQYKKHRAILCFYSIRFNDNITKVSAIETRKTIKNQMKNAGQKPLLRIKR